LLALILHEADRLMIPVRPIWEFVGVPVSIVHTRIATLPVASVVYGN